MLKRKRELRKQYNYIKVIATKYGSEQYSAAILLYYVVGIFEKRTVSRVTTVNTYATCIVLLTVSELQY